MKQAAEKSQQAQQSMQKAQQNLDKPQAQGAQASQQQKDAQKKMEEAKKKLDELAKRPLNDEEKKKAEQLAKKQEQTKNLTEELEKQLEQMQKEQAKRSAQSAKGNMQQAQKNLQQSQPQDSQEDEEKALEDLKQAEQELQDALDELKRIADEELMIELQTELRKIIEAQETLINKPTKDLDEIRRKKGALERGEVIKSKGLAKRQQDLGASLQEINKKLKGENVDVFHYVIGAIIGDMGDVTVYLNDAETGLKTQDLEAETVRKMKDLLEAFDIKKKQAKGGGQGQGQGSGKKPLVPDLVQLNMMKKLQEQLLARTLNVHKAYRADREDMTPAEKQTLKRLSDEQDKLKDLMQKFIDKFDDQKKKYEKDNNPKKGDE
jgi:hypothetical protein